MEDDDIDVWLNRSRNLLASARGHEDRVAEVIEELSLIAFRDLNFSPMIVWDYLAISTPGLFGEAGYSDAEVEALTPVVEMAIAKAVQRSRDE